MLLRGLHPRHHVKATLSRHFSSTPARMVKVIVGMMGSSVGKGSNSLSTKAQVQSFLDVVGAHDILELDTARVYAGGRSEELLGEVNACDGFAISTKAPAFSPGSLTEANILDNASKSFIALRLDTVDIYYLHGPDSETPLIERCRAMAKLHAQDRFERWGVSNIPDAVVQEIHDICKREGWPLPSVYQGAFSPLHRKAQTTLFPLLRKLNMSFYAFSPLAGGLLAKPLDEILKPAAGTRFSEMPVFGDLFLNETIIGALKTLTAACEKEGLGLMEATLRWCMHHSPLGEEDGIILGASRVEQIEASLTATEKGPLPKSLVDEYETLWTTIEDKAPGYC